MIIIIYYMSLKFKKYYNYYLNLSGTLSDGEQSKNIQHILVTLVVFHLDISGNFNNDEHPWNI